MLHRRQFLERTLKGSSLIALGNVVPGFLTATAQATTPGKENILVVLEMTGGNDGLNTVVPYADDNYYQARRTIGLKKTQIVRVNDQVGLNPGMRSFEKLLQKNQLAIVQGVGYPNPDRSHFESMDVWQSGDPKRKVRTGWLGRGLNSLTREGIEIPGIFVGKEQLPLAMHGSSTGVPTIHATKPYDLELALPQDVRQYYDGRRVVVEPVVPSVAVDSSDGNTHYAARRRLIEQLAKLPPSGDNLLPFVQRSTLQTYSTIGRLRQIIEEERLKGFGNNGFRNQNQNSDLSRDLDLVAHMIAADFGTRIFYVSLAGFDTHANQLQGHQQLLQQVADGVTNFFETLGKTGNANRVALMTFSEFGRRVQENGSQGTDHGAGSCLFVAGPGVKGGVVGSHPRMGRDDLDSGDLKHHTDFRQVYATLLQGWLGCDSRQVLGGDFTLLPLLKKG